MFVHLGRRTDLFNAPAIEDGEPIAHRQRLLLVVGDVDEGDADLTLDRLQLNLHLFTQLQIKRAEWFVQK